MYDSDAWLKYPHHRKWFNKLYVSERLGYNCGPSGISPYKSDFYIVRPIYNLSGMGVGTSKQYIRKNDTSKVPPGYFWCDFFNGEQYSCTYEYDNGWKLLHTYKGLKEDFSFFYKWEKVNFQPKKLPDFLEELKDVNIINIEFIDEKIIEIHLRGTPDPLYDILIPIWNEKDIEKYKKKNYIFVESYDNADGFLFPPRLGFACKNNSY